jgi:hypothetical protein
VGEPVVHGLETAFDFVASLVRDGPAAAWEKIREQLGNLQDTVIGGITDFVVDTVVKKAIPKLISMFVPGAGFISAILSIYDIIMVFVHKISKIAQVVTAFIGSIAAIAGGAVVAAAKRVEHVLAGLLSLAISFLTGFAGLGKVSDKVLGVIGKVRATVDRAIDTLVAWIVTAAKKLFGALFGKKDEKGGAKAATAQKGFSLPEEGHTVTAGVKEGRLTVRIASDREGEILAMLADASAEVAADPLRDSDQKKRILGDLSGARDMVKSMSSDWKAAADQTQDFPLWAEARMTQIVNILTHLGADGIKAFRDFKGRPLDKRYLPPGYDVREKLYLRGSGWSGNRATVASAGRSMVLADVKAIITHRTTAPAVAQAAWSRLVREEQAPDGATLQNVTLAHVTATQYDVDHIDTLSLHWQNGGNNGGDADRWALSRPGRLRYITQKANLARGKGKYVGWVGKGFVSSYAQGGAANARKIDGQPFLDGPGGKPI